MLACDPQQSLIFQNAIIHNPLSPENYEAWMNHPQLGNSPKSYPEFTRSKYRFCSTKLNEAVICKQ